MPFVPWTLNPKEGVNWCVDFVKGAWMNFLGRLSAGPLWNPVISSPSEDNHDAIICRYFHCDRRRVNSSRLFCGFDVCRGEIHCCVESFLGLTKTIVNSKPLWMTLSAAARVSRPNRTVIAGRTESLSLALHYCPTTVTSNYRKHKFCFVWMFWSSKILLLPRP